MPQTLKLALVTDIHNGRDSLTKKGAAALGLLQDFAAFVEAEQPDLVIDLGDRITDTGRDIDEIALRDVSERFRSMRAPRLHLLGNHDVGHLSVEDNERLLAQSMRSCSMDIKGWHLVFWQANVNISLHTPLALREADLAWLAADLAATALPCIVFTHVPLDGASMTGNFYFEGSPQVATYANVDAAQAVIATAGNVAACVAGHVHWNNVSRINGVPYLSLQSLTESFTTTGEACGAWATIEADGQLRWQGHGADPIALTINTGGGNRRWTRPLGPLSALTRRRKRNATGLDGVKALLTDLDGVIYRDMEPIAGAARFLQDVMATGRQVVAITNNARATANQYQHKLAGMGVELAPHNIITSAHALAAHVRTLDAPRVFFAASPALRQEILAAGAVEHDEPDYVIAGMDEALTLAVLNQAVGHLARGAELLASNADVAIPTAEGQAAEAGAVVAFLETASGQRAQTFGKPNEAIYALALARIGCAARDAIMIGDTYDTDILGANRAGIRAVYVQSGNPPDEASHAVPAVVVSDITALRPLLGL